MLPPMPELEPVDGAVGLVVVPGVLPMPDEDEPELPLDALRESAWHLSRSAPVRPTHLLASLPDAPDAAPLLPDVPEVLLLSVEPELDDDAPLDGRVVLLPDDELPVEGEVVLLPDEPAPALPEVPDAPVLPLLEPEDWANAAPDRARSAAAVAAVIVFNII